MQKVLNYEKRIEVYQKVNGLPDLKHFTVGNKYAILNEIIEGEEETDPWVPFWLL